MVNVGGLAYAMGTNSDTSAQQAIFTPPANQTFMVFYYSFSTDSRAATGTNTMSITNGTITTTLASNINGSAEPISQSCKIYLDDTMTIQIYSSSYSCGLYISLIRLS